METFPQETFFQLPYGFGLPYKYWSSGSFSFFKKQLGEANACNSISFRDWQIVNNKNGYTEGMTDWNEIFQSIFHLQAG